MLSGRVKFILERSILVAGYKLIKRVMRCSRYIYKTLLNIHVQLKLFIYFVECIYVLCVYTVGCSFAL